MKMEKVNSWIAIGANLGVIAGIVFLVIEVHQNNEQLEIQSYQSWVASNLQLNIAATNPELSAILIKGNLSPGYLSQDTFVSFAMWNMGIMQMAQTTDYLYRSGSMDKNLWEAEISRAAGFLSLPGVRQWWDAGGKTQLTPEFVSLLESTESTITTWGWEPEKGFIQTDLTTK